MLCLMVGFFLNPLGFDVLFKMVLDLTHDYWIATACLYCAAAVFFGLYFLLAGINPFKSVYNSIRASALSIRAFIKK
jgi:hypothetical protein